MIQPVKAILVVNMPVTAAVVIFQLVNNSYIAIITTYYWLYNILMTSSFVKNYNKEHLFHRNAILNIYHKYYS